MLVLVLESKEKTTYHSPVTSDEIFERDSWTDADMRLNAIPVQQSQQEKAIILIPLHRLQELLSWKS